MNDLQFDTDYKEVVMSEKVRVNFPEDMGYSPFIELIAKNESGDLPYFELLPSDIRHDHFLFRHQTPLPEGTQFLYILYYTEATKEGMNPGIDYEKILINL